MHKFAIITSLSIHTYHVNILLIKASGFQFFRQFLIIIDGSKIDVTRA